MKCQLIITDEVNCHFIGLQTSDINHIIEKTKVRVKNAFHDARFKLGVWDGKESQFKEDGSTFAHMLDDVLQIVEYLGYNVDLIDQRRAIHFPANIDENYLTLFGVTLRPYQVESVNLTIEHHKGIINISTSGGKTLVCASIAKIYNDVYRTLVIVPSKKLAKQTYKDFIAVNLETGMNHGDIKNKDDEFKKRHVISTWQSLKDQREHLHKFDVILYDECHVMGDVMFDLLSTDLAYAPIRLGFTGTVPKDKLKQQKVFCHIGGTILKKVTAKELQDDGYICTVDIDMIPVNHDIEIPDSLEWTWELEEQYLLYNKDRIATITNFIDVLPKENILILCHPALGSQIANNLELDFIDKDTKDKYRDEYFDNFTTRTDYKLAASFGTSGTGISVNEIDYIVTIDVGKNETRILQGIGRGLRKGGKTDHLKVYDLYSRMFRMNKIDNTKLIEYSYSGGKHLIARKRIYKNEKYPFVEHTAGITV